MSELEENKKMSLKNELTKKAIKNGAYNKESVLRDISNKAREIEQAELQLESLKKEVEFTKKEEELFNKISKVMLDNYGKVESSMTHSWELNPEYWVLMRQKQEIDNERTLEKFKNQAKTIEVNIDKTINHIEDLKNHKLMAEMDLKDFEGEDDE